MRVSSSPEDTSSAPAPDPSFASTDPMLAAAQLAAIVDASDDAIVTTDIACIIRIWSRGAERLFGYSAEEMVGRSLVTLVPDDRLGAEGAIIAALTRGERLTAFESEWLAQSGERLALAVNAAPVVDATGGVLGLSFVARHDHGDRNAQHGISEEKIRLERDFSAALISSLPGVLYMYDEDGQFIRWNANFETVTGYTGAELAAMTPLDVIAHPDKELVASRIRDVFAAGSSTVEAELRAKDGRITPYYFTGLRTSFAGRNCLIGVGIDISAYKLAEAERQATETRYRTLFDHAPDGIVIVDRTGNLRDCNPGACRLLGYEPEELTALHGTRLIAQSDIDQVAPAFEIAHGGNTHRREWQLLRKDGSTFPADVMATLIPNGDLLAMIRDVSEQKQAEAQVFASEARLRRAQRIAQLGSWELDVTSDTLTWSDEIFRIFGIAMHDFRATYAAFLEAVHPDDRDMVHAAQERAKTGEVELAIEHRIVRPDGAIRWVFELGEAERDATGRPTRLTGTVLDITARKEAERALREANDTLEVKVAERTSAMQAAVERAEAADRIKSAFLAAMSHELRTPLNSIIGFTGILLQGLAGPLNAEQGKQLGMVRGSARHLLALINDILDISKIEAEQLAIVRAPFDVRESIMRVTDNMRTMAESKGLDFVTDISPALGMMIGDCRRVEQILLNFVSNAIKFTEHGQVGVSAELIPPDRRVSGVAAVEALRLRVTDTGIGIKPDDLARLFQPFTQIDTGLARQHEGTGLGLAICRRLATLMDGDVSVTSEWGRGSEFTLTIPYRRAEAA